MDSNDKMMRCIECSEINRDLEGAIQNLKVVTKPIPIPKKGQVLVKMKAAPCNPSDLLFLQGMYGVRKVLPTTPGWEGAGLVVANGGGLLARFLQGKRVACAGQKEGDGTWAEYCVMDANQCLPLLKGVSYEQGATLIINPLTAYGMVEQARSCGHRALIQTAAAGQLGRMVNYLCQRASLPLINIVRRQEQADLLKAEGAKYILDSSDPDFRQKLKKLADDLGTTCALEPIAGEMTGTVIHAMPPKSVAYVYGALSEKACEHISPLDLIFEEKRVQGYWLSKWLASTSFFGLMKASRTIQNWMAKGDFTTKIKTVVGLDQFPGELLNYHSNMTAGKVILNPEK